MRLKYEGVFSLFCSIHLNSCLLCFYAFTENNKLNPTHGLHRVAVYSSTQIRGQTPGTPHLVSGMLDLPGWPIKHSSNQTAMRQLGFSGAAYCGSLNSTQSAAAAQTAVLSNIHTLQQNLFYRDFCKRALHNPNLTHKNCIKTWVWVWHTLQDVRLTL